MIYTQSLASPFGPLQVCASPEGVTAVHFCEQPAPAAPNAITRQACEQLEAYFAGTLQDFSVPLAATGTAFQQQVWHALQEVGYGTTTSYGAIAHAIGRPKAMRAVGLANGRNPIAIIVPCHRIIGANGKLTGYAGGLTRKAGLLALEKAGLPCQ